MQTVYSFTAPPATAGDTGYLTHTANLSAYAGQTIRIFFLENIPQPSTGPGQFEIDSVSLNALPQAAAPFDFDGDRRADFVNFRPSNGFVYISRPNNSFSGFPFGIAGDDIFAPGNYDGDGKFDIAVFRSSTGIFYVLRSSDNALAIFQFGTNGDEPVARDYDGDGRTDFAVVRSGTVFTWYILQSSNNSLRAVQFGAKPQLTVQNDYDGDGKTDIATYNPLNGSYYVLQSSNGATVQTVFGQNGDYPVANYNAF